MPRTGEQHKKYHPSDFTHGILAAHAGSETGHEAGKSKIKADDPVVLNKEKGEYQKLLAKGIELNDYIKNWKVLEVVEDAQTGYLGIIYVNDVEKQLVLGHRSTNFKLSLTTSNIFKQSGVQQDVEGVLLGTILMHQTHGYAATAKAIDYTNDTNGNYKGYALSFTGHSLGAWLAQLSVYYSHDDLNYTSAKAVTFDGPGAYEMMKQMSACHVKGASKSLTLKQLDITGYLSAPNIVNCTNKHVGTVYRLFPKIEIEGSNIVAAIAGDKNQDALLATLGHDMKHILPHFNKISGKPDKYEQVQKWPSITHIDFGKKSEHDLSSFISKVHKITGIVQTSLAKTTTSMAAKVLTKILGSETTTIGSLVYMFTDLMEGKITQEHFWEVHKYLDKSLGYDVKSDMNAINDFALLYKGNYQTIEVDLYIRKAGENPTDECLKILAEKSEDAIRTCSNKQMVQQLLELKAQYGYNRIDNKFEVVTEHKNRSVVNMEDIADQVKFLISRNSLKKHIEEISGNETLTSAEERIADDLPKGAPGDFVGREEIFTKMDQLFGQDQAVETKQIVIISAFRGTGKTSTALEYAYRHGDENKGTVLRWIDADTKNKIEKDYRTIAEDLGQDVKDKTSAEIIRMVNNKMVKIKNFSAMFIFDNVESYEDIKDYLVNLPKAVKVIITTRVDNLIAQNSLRDAAIIELEPFTEKEAITYLTKDSRIDNIDAGSIIKAIGLLPSKLSKSKALINEKELLKVSNFVDSYAKDIESKLITELVKSEKSGSEAAWQILQYAAHLDPDFIPIEIFKSLLSCGDEDLYLPIERLKSLSLVTVQHKQQEAGLRLHRLVQQEVNDYTKQHLEEAIGAAIIFKLLHNLNILSLNTSPCFAAEYRTAELMQVHVTKVAEEAIKIPEITDQNPNFIEDLAIANHNLSFYHRNISCNYDKALEYAKKALQLYQELHPDTANANTAISLNSVGVVYYELGYTRESLKFFEQALEMNQKLQDSNHAVAASLNHVGTNYHALGDIQRGLKFREQALTMTQELYTDNHPAVSDSLNNLGSSYHELGDIKKGLEFYKQALKMRQELYPGNHPVVANSLNNVGIGYSALGYVEEGLKFYKQALKMGQELYFGNHPSVANFLHSVGVGYSALGRIERGLEFYKQALKMRQELYPGNHPSVANSLNNVGASYHALKDVKEGLKFKEKALMMRQELHSGNHPDVAASLNNVGLSYHVMGDVQRGLEFYKQALKMRQELYPGNHPGVADSLDSVGLSYHDLGYIKEGLKFEKEALIMRQELYHGNHPDVADSLNNIGVSYHALGYIKEGLKFHNQALMMRQKLHHGDHPDVADSLKNVSSAYWAIGNRAKALELYKQAYVMKLKTLGATHPQTIADKENLLLLAPEFINSNETREPIILQSKFNETALRIQQKIQVKILDKVCQLAAAGKWSQGYFLPISPTILPDWGVNGYTSGDYLRKALEELANPGNIKIAQRLCFEAINLGIMSSNQKNFTCITEFVRANPSLLKAIIELHPEYFVDGSIVRACISNTITLARLLGEDYAEHITGQGVEYYPNSSYWHEYSAVAMQELLKLRLKETMDAITGQAIAGQAITEQKNDQVNIISLSKSWSEGLDISADLYFSLIENVNSGNMTNINLIPLNLYNEHWVGVAIEAAIGVTVEAGSYTEPGTIKISYMDPEQRSIPPQLKDQLLKAVSWAWPQAVNIQIEEVELAKQNSNNCGPEVIENFILCLTGDRVDQESVLPYHSKLMEQKLAASVYDELDSYVQPRELLSSNSDGIDFYY